jgi:hypothetical protein
MYLLLKDVLSGAVIAVASEAARRSSLLGAVIISLPLTSLLAIVLLYRDIAFWPSLLLACGATGVSYAVWVWAGRRAGLDL